MDKVLPAPSPRPLADRILRVVAVFCLGRGVIDLIISVKSLSGGVWWQALKQFAGHDMNLKPMTMVYIYLSLLSGLLLLPASIGLWTRKRWALRIIFAWACVELLSAAALVLEIVPNTLHPPGARASIKPIATEQILMSIIYVSSQVFQQLAFPLLVGWLVLQRDVRELWMDTRKRAFEVIPIADGSGDATSS